MSDFLDNPLQAAAIDDALKDIDATALAEKSNLLTGGCLRGDDVLKVARMVCLTALRTPRKLIRVAGICAAFDRGQLTLSVSGGITDISIPNPDDL